MPPVRKFDSMLDALLSAGSAPGDAPGPVTDLLRRQEGLRA